MKIVATDHHVVVWDPMGSYWDGALVRAAQANILTQEGAALLPVVPEMLRMSGASGYAKRSWGAGIPLDASAPRFTAPLVLYCDPAHRGLAWRARLVLDPSFPPSQHHEGTLRFASDGGQRIPQKATYSELGEPTPIRSLGPADPHGGWTVGGEGQVSVASEGHYGFAMYGYAPGLRVAWVAASTLLLA